MVSTAKILNIDHLLERKPKELSGGQRQRVAIGRAIVRNPYAFLFDEPLSNLDYSLRCQMRYEIAKLKERLKTTMVYVTHDQAEAMTLADKIVVMKDGKIEQQGTPLEIYNSPVNTFVAKFIGSSEMNIIPVVCESTSEKSQEFKFETGEVISIDRADCEVKKGEKYLLGFRPEDLTVTEIKGDKLKKNSLVGTVVLAENLGGDGFIHVSLQNGTQINVKSNKSVTEKIGDKVSLSFNHKRCYLFDSDGNTIFGIKQ